METNWSVRVVGFVVAAGAVLLGILMGSPLIVFFDIPSALFVAVPVLGGLWAAHGWGWSGLLRQGARPGARAEQSRGALAIVRTARRLAWLAGGVGVLIGAVQIAQRLADPAALGPAVAVCLLSLTYAAVLDLLVLTPLQGHVEHQRARTAGEAGE